MLVKAQVLEQPVEEAQARASEQSVAKAKEQVQAQALALVPGGEGRAQVLLPSV